MIDSHCHLDHEPLFENLDEVLKRSKAVGIKKLLTICRPLKGFEKIKKIVKQDKIGLLYPSPSPRAPSPARSPSPV